MKLYGIEVTFTAEADGSTRESVDNLLDTMHDVLSLNEHVYSADLVAEGTRQIALLLGVKVSDDDGADAAGEYAKSALESALAEAGVTGASLDTVRRKPAQELALVS